MAELRTIHLGEPASEQNDPRVIERLTDAYADALWCPMWTAIESALANVVA
jgi:hypothetical protein